MIKFKDILKESKERVFKDSSGEVTIVPAPNREWSVIKSTHPDFKVGDLLNDIQMNLKNQGLTLQKTKPNPELTYLSDYKPRR